jgi:hypothetical protein
VGPVHLAAGRLVDLAPSRLAGVAGRRPGRQRDGPGHRRLPAGRLGGPGRRRRRRRLAAVVRELRIEPTTYQGYEAALWEYTYQGQHATNLGIVTPGPGYALNFQTAESRWAESQDVREAFEAGFTIPD